MEIGFRHCPRGTSPTVVAWLASAQNGHAFGLKISHNDKESIAILQGFNKRELEQICEENTFVSQ